MPQLARKGIEPMDIVITGMARTPFGSFMGGLASLSGPQLGAIAIRAAVQRSGILPGQVSEVIMGQVLTAGAGQAPARQAAIGAGLPVSVPALTINKVCGSGMKAVMLGVQAIWAGESDIVVAGGMESMSQAPYLLKQVRAGLRMGDQVSIDSMIHDGLMDPSSQEHMGVCAEACSRKYQFSREQQDAFAAESYRRALAAQTEGKFVPETVSVEVAAGRERGRVEHDEEPGRGKPEKFPTLKPAFASNGTITAANASSLNDGAAAMVLMSADTARELGCAPLAVIRSSATHALEPSWFTLAPIEALRKALDKAGWNVADVDLFEINEAFSSVAMAAVRELEIGSEKLNIWGGAVALGHPIGASGARIIITLVSALRDRKLRRGAAGICIGGGEATALCLEAV